MKKMLEKEGISESAVWPVAIHYNTEHIHVHIATVEPGKSQRPMRENGEPKGVWRQSTLKAGKASAVNAILMQQEENHFINDLIRKNIVGGKWEKMIAYDKDLRQTFLRVYNNMPVNKQYWNYNCTNLGNLTRKNLDELSRLYIQKFHQKDYEAFKENVKIQQEKYREAYGDGEKVVNQYVENKEKELYERLKNSILKEMKYDRRFAMKERQGRLSDKKMAGYKLAGTLNRKLLADHNIRIGIQTM